MKHVVNIAGFIAILRIMQLGVIQLAEIEALRPVIGNFDSGTLTIDDWLREFYKWASYTTWAGAFSFVVWYLFGQFTSPDWSGLNNKRPWWIVGIFFPGVMAVIAIFMLPIAHSGTWLANAFLVFDGIFTYWLSSAMFSPTMVKTHPPFSRGLRRLRDALPW